MFYVDLDIRWFINAWNFAVCRMCTWRKHIGRMFTERFNSNRTYWEEVHWKV